MIISDKKRILERSNISTYFFTQNVPAGISQVLWLELFRDLIIGPSSLLQKLHYKIHNKKFLPKVEIIPHSHCLWRLWQIPSLSLGNLICPRLYFPHLYLCNQFVQEYFQYLCNQPLKHHVPVPGKDSNKTSQWGMSLWPNQIEFYTFCWSSRLSCKLGFLIHLIGFGRN